jgi:hypothetical protein
LYDERNGGIELKEPSNSTHPIYTINPRTYRQILMDVQGLTPSSVVQCFICHEQHLVAEMEAHHMLPQEICRAYPWHQHKITDPANLEWVDYACHEKWFNRKTISWLQHKLAAAQLELRELKGEDN